MLNFERGFLNCNSPGNESLTLFAWNLPFHIDEYAIRKLFEQARCDVEDVRLIRNFKGISKGYAYIEMKNQESMENGQKLNETEVEGRPIKVSISKNKQELIKKPLETRLQS